MRERRGYISNGPGRERDVLGCAHCRRQLVVTPPKGAESVRLDRCGQCTATICRRCAAELARTLKCDPFEARMERAEARGRMLAAIGAQGD